MYLLASGRVGVAQGLNNHNTMPEHNRPAKLCIFFGGKSVLVFILWCMVYDEGVHPQVETLLHFISLDNPLGQEGTPIHPGLSLRPP